MKSLVLILALSSSLSALGQKEVSRKLLFDDLVGILAGGGAAGAAAMLTKEGAGILFDGDRKLRSLHASFERERQNFLEKSLEKNENLHAIERMIRQADEKLDAFEVLAKGQLASINGVIEAAERKLHLQKVL